MPAPDPKNLRKLWKNDLERTGYGQQLDAQPPRSRIHFGFMARPNHERQLWLARVVRRLRERGYQWKVIAYMLNLPLSSLHKLRYKFLDKGRTLNR